MYDFIYYLKDFIFKVIYNKYNKKKASRKIPFSKFKLYPFGLSKYFKNSLEEFKSFLFNIITTKPND